MEYKILSDTNWKNLEFAVNRYIQKGWKPLGGISAGGVGISIIYCQAMILIVE